MQPQRVEPETAAWYLYRFETDLRCPLGCPAGAHPLYRGKSNEPLRRLLEHAKDQPWWPHVTGWSVNPEVYASNGDVLVAEKAAILAELPLANKEHNGRNPHRIEFGQAVSRAPRPRAASPARQPTSPRRSWSRRQKRIAGMAALWVVLAIAGWVASVHWAHLQVWGGARAGVFGASAVFVVAWQCRPKRRRKRRRR